MCARNLWAMWAVVFILLSVTTLIAVPQGVVINEVGWAGTAASPYDEWIELYNPSEEPVNLTGWALVIGEAVIHLWGVEGVSVDVRNSILEAGGFFLLERSDDATICDIEADLIYKALLPNSGTVIRLFDPSGREVDTANLGREGWAAGSAAGEPAYASMERVDPTGPDVPANWRTNDGTVRCGHDAEGDGVNGTPRAKNSATVAFERVPVVEILAPADKGEEVRGLFIVAWAATDPDGPPERLRIDLYLSRDGGASWEPLIDGLANGGFYAWETVPLPDGENYQLMAVATDGDSLSGEGISPIFSIVNAG